VIRKILASALALGLIGATIPSPAQAGGNRSIKQYKHVLLISIDGLHALDVANYVHNHPGSALAKLASHGVTYSNARTPANSDSFPGLLALVTAGSPLSHGLFYDVSYNRGIYDPTNTTCKGQAGNMQVFDESIDVYNAQNVSENVIDPTKLPNYINGDGHCVRFYPHNAMESNTIFEVVKAEHGLTAWADKHPAYDIVNGPSGHGVDDLYTPELTNAPGFDNTVSVVCTVMNDELKVKAILNEIHGLTHDGKPAKGTPAVFGMNFQAVSVGQKLEIDNKAGGCTADTDPAINGQPGGYLDGLGTPTKVLEYGLQKTDEALADMISALKSAGIYESTLFIVTAKHGQSPINPAKVNKPGHFADLVAALPDASTSAAAQAIASANACSTGPCGFVQDDDIALIWLQDQSQTTAVANYLNTNAKALFIDEVMAGRELTLKFRNPLKETRTPDILVQPIYGTIYTGSTAKNAEHGGFSFADTNVGLIVSNPDIDAKTVKSLVATSQVGATILQALGIDPSKLDAVRREGTDVLPFFSDSEDDE
jgi:Type I phosphodiesterase / nucleotide pyrophosphatase